MDELEELLEELIEESNMEGVIDAQGVDINLHKSNDIKERIIRLAECEVESFEEHISDINSEYEGQIFDLENQISEINKPPSIESVSDQDKWDRILKLFPKISEEELTTLEDKYD